MDAHLQTTLLILLAGGFVILLILSCILVFFLITILRHVARITERADNATANFSETLQAVFKRLAPMAATPVAGALLRRWRRKRKERAKQD